jgi:hypothetical protein
MNGAGSGGFGGAPTEAPQPSGVDEGADSGSQHVAAVGSESSSGPGVAQAQDGVPSAAGQPAMSAPLEGCSGSASVVCGSVSAAGADAVGDVAGAAAVAAAQGPWAVRAVAAYDGAELGTLAFEKDEIITGACRVRFG